MRVEDLTVEVRNASLERVGQLIPEDLVGATFVLRHNNIGSWEVRLPFGHALGEALRLPGYGILVLGPNDEVILSGPTLMAKLEQKPDNIKGDWVITGADDSILLNERLAYPTPTTDDLTAQTEAEDIRSGFAEAIIKQYLDANVGASAPVSRQIANLTIEANSNRGTTVNASARFNKLQELFYDIAQVGGIGYRILQDGETLEFSVYVPEDRSATVRLDLENNQLSSSEYAYANPRITRAIVGGPGEAEDRELLEVTTAESLEAESAWGRRIEVFTDSRGTEEENDLQQSGLAALVDEGKTIIAISATPSDDQSVQYGKDWFLGDTITVIANDLEASAVVTEIGISIQDDGVRIGATIGTPVAMEYETKLLAKQENQEKRLSNLERSVTGYGINTAYDTAGGTDGTQPTFSGPAIFGTYNRFGNMVHFSVLVDFDNITSFGTGQYYLTLPYPAKVAYQFRDGCLHDASAGTEYQVSGHVFAGETTLWLNIADKIASGIQDVPFTSTVPVTLTTEDSFHIAGTYEIGE
jgi:hypothetical protein